MPLNAEEEFQLEWIKNHQMEDKDELAEIQAEAEAEARPQRATRGKKMRDDLLIAGLSVLRVIHGGGNPEYGNVKRIIDRKVRSEWKNRVVFYKVEPDNAGSSIMKIGKPRFFALTPLKVDKN